MALKPHKQHVPILTEEQVIKMRKRYYHDGTHLKTLMEEYGISKGTAFNAVKGIGAYYSSIEDGIPQEVKESRVRCDHKYSMNQMKRLSTNRHTHNYRSRNPFKH